jgi:hypothetical protein
MRENEGEGSRLELSELAETAPLGEVIRTVG